MVNYEAVYDGETINEVNEKLSLIQKKDGLKFSTDAYLLAAFVKSDAGGVLVDLGSGTGIIPLLCLTKGKCKSAYAVEIQPSFAELISRNAELNGLSSRLTAISADLRDESKLPTAGAASIVTANPPYQKATHGFASSADEMTAARREENGDIFDFCRSASRLLKFGGLFYAVFVPDRLTDLLCAMRSASIEPKKLVTVYPDVKSKPCLVLVEGKKGASPSMVPSPPLVIYSSTDKTEKREYTPEMQAIYDNFTLAHLFDDRRNK